METKRNFKEVPAICLGADGTIKDDGDPILKETAAGYVTNYLDGVNDHPGVNHNYGFVFGLNKVNDFMDAIAAYNDNDELTPDEMIAGVRVYLARKAPVPAGAGLPLDQILDTLFMMPVLATGFDLYKMPPLVDHGDIILGNPRPCPNECLLLSFATE